MNKVTPIIIWFILWIPLSFLFPSESHFPISGVFAPITALVLPFSSDASQSTTSFDWWYVYFPALFFWLGGIVFVLISQKLWKKNLHLILVASVLQISFIIGLVFIRLSDNFAGFYTTLFIMTIICTATLFAFGIPILSRLFSALEDQAKSTQLVVQAQFLLHIIVVAFIIFDQFYGIDYSIMLRFSPFLIAFFITARLTWQTCFTKLKSKIYKIFTTGSTALFVWCVVLTLLGIFYQERFLTQNLHTLLIVYFTVHFAELGFVLLKINKDLKAI